MQSNFTYRSIALTLAIIFALFSIGLPIVIASCPMMEMTQGVACCAMNDDAASGVVRITNSVDKPCCETKYTAERNKNEFLQTQMKNLDATKFVVQFVANIEHQSAICNPQSAITLNASPPRSVDIPILVSSLLI
jgi:hypothetical protein